MKDGSKLRYDPNTIDAIATEAVKGVYQYGASVRGDPFKDLREQRAQRFRREYGSDTDGHSNEFPYFIGVFDTVAALGVAPRIRIALGVAAVIAVALLTAGLAWLLAGWLFSFLTWFIVLCLLPSLFAIIAYLKTHLRYHPEKKRFYLAEWSMKFYDNKLNRRVGYARHALSIDETRADFEPVKWIFDGDARLRTENEPELLRQVWFAGDHSDIGGSYIENESRLSDNALKWLTEQIEEVPHPIVIDGAVLQLYPSGTGPQHDEARKGFSGMWGRLGFKWPIKLRRIDTDAPLHPSVLERFAAKKALIYDRMMAYRPEQLRHHVQVRHFYE